MSRGILGETPSGPGFEGGWELDDCIGMKGVYESQGP